MEHICFFNSVKFWGGGEKLHLEYALKFSELNYRVVLAAGKGSPLQTKGREAGLPTFTIDAGNLSFLNPVKLISLVRFFKKEKIDTIIISSSHDLKLGALAAKLAGVRSIVYLRGLATPVKNSLLNRYLFGRVLTHIVANSEETRRTILKNLHSSVPAGKVHVIYHGIDLNLFDQQSGTITDSRFRSRPGVILGNAGRLTPQKGQHHLIDVATRLKQKGVPFTLLIAGTGEMQPALEKLIVRNGLQEEVILLGFVEKIEPFMQAIDIFVLSSLWEGFGYVIVEAMAARKPAIAFNLTSNPEIIADRETGFLVDYPDLDAFCAKTEMLITDPSLRKAFGEKGRQTVEKRFLLDDRIAEFERCLLAGDSVIN